MNKKSKALQERNKQIQAQYSKELGKKSKTSILSIYAEHAHPNMVADVVRIVFKLVSIPKNAN